MDGFPRPPRLHRFAPLAGALALAAAAACSPQPSPRTAAAGTAPGPDAEAAADRAKVAAGSPAAAVPPSAEPSAPAAKTLEPPDGVWLKDENGDEYFLLEVPKRAYYNRISEDKVQVDYGLVLTIAKEDENSYWVKMFRTPSFGSVVEGEGATGEREAAQPPAPEPEASAASDRLGFIPFDRGLPRRGQWRNGFVVVDFDGDGHPDIVHGPPRKSDPPMPRIFLGDGKGGWQPWGAPSFQSPRLDYGDVAVADFNGDGRLDVALAVHLRGIVVLVDAGDHRFVPWSEGIEYASPEEHEGTAAFSSRRLEAVDWNGDGLTDLVAVGEGPALSRSGSATAFFQGITGPEVFLNRGDGSWDRLEGSGGVRPFGDDLAVGDLDGDGRLDVVTASAVLGQRGILYLGQADGSLREVDLEGVRPQSIVRSVTIADFNGDGRLDLALGYSSHEIDPWWSGVDVLLARAGGGFDRVAVAREEGRDTPISLATGDLDADGHPDLVAATDDGKIWILLGDGRGGFTRDGAAGLEPPGRRCSGYHVALADLDGEPGDELVAGFAGEAGSEQIFALSTETGGKTCPSGGALAAWKALRRP